MSRICLVAVGTLAFAALNPIFGATIDWATWTVSAYLDQRCWHAYGGLANGEH